LPHGIIPRHRAPIGLLTNIPDAEKLLGNRCGGGHAHMPLIGQVKFHGRSLSRARQAEKYPHVFAVKIAAVLAEALTSLRQGQRSLLAASGSGNQKKKKPAARAPPSK
jgi:hypothetical protein